MELQNMQISLTREMK